MYQKSNVPAAAQRSVFGVSDATGETMAQRIVSKLAQWPGGRYKNKPRDEKDCYNKTRTYWNRQKAQSLGDYLFGPIVGLAFQVRCDVRWHSL